jgi:HK97 family phage portal protein
MLSERLFERRGEEIAHTGTLTSPSISLISALGGGPTASGVRMSPAIAEGIPAYFACRQVITETTGQLPFKIYRKLARGKRPDEQHHLYYVLHDQFNPEMTAYEGKELLTRNVADHGNGYAEIQYNQAGRPIALWPLASQRMIVDRDELNRRRYRYHSAAKQNFEWIFNPARPPIFHLRANTLDGLTGRGVPSILAECFGLAKAAEEFGSRFFNGDAMPGVIATYKGKLTPVQKQNLRESYTRVNGGLTNAHRLRILENDIKVEKMSFNPQESQFNELRGLQIEEIARTMRVPLFLIQHMSKSTSWGSGLEQAMRGFINMTLMPWLTIWQQGVGMYLLTRKSFETHCALFVVEALQRADFLAHQQGLDIQFRNGAVTRNEWRQLVDREAHTDEFADQPMVPINNMVPASLASEVFKKQGQLGMPATDPEEPPAEPSPVIAEDPDKENDDAA